MNGTRTTNLICTVVLAAWALAAGSAHAQGETGDRFAEGNRLFCREDYEGAIGFYESVLQGGGANRNLFYNLAGAYRGNGEVGGAVLNYERALWMAPRDPDAATGLETLRGDAALFQTPHPVWQNVLLRIGLEEWTWLAALSWAVLCALTLLHGLGWVKRRMFRWMVAFSIACLVLGGAGAAVWLQRMDRAVVMVDHAPLLMSPYEGAKHTATIREGRVVEMKEVYGTFVKVLADGGRTGWMPSRDVSRIVPLDRPRRVEQASGWRVDPDRYTNSAGTAGQLEDEA